MRNNPDIEGINVNGIVNLLSQFADDMQVFTLYKKASLQAIINELSYFECISGMKVNYDKTSIYRIGSLANSQAKLYVSREFQWTNEPLDILGVTLSNDAKCDMECNFLPMFQKAQNTLEAWKGRDMSLLGKIQVLNSLIASLFGYRMAVMPQMTEKQRTDLRHMFNKFIWNRGSAKI